MDSSTVEAAASEEFVSQWISLLNFLTDHAAWLIIFSFLTALLTLALVPVLITRIPEDYFSRGKRLPASRQHALYAFISVLAKNILGAVFLLIGFVLLFLPGQGLIMIFVGLLIMNYPGKYALERWLVQRRGVLHALNALRARYDKPPLRLP